MPVIENSTYRAKGVFKHGHINTIYHGLFRRVPLPPYQRERIPTPDGDFLDLDWLRSGQSRLLIALHGLEGSTERPYMRGLFRYFTRHGWDTVGMNFRSCSGPMNKRLRMYNMGETEDLHTVVQHVTTLGYAHIAIVGFSLGGNVTLKYMGESGHSLHTSIRAAVAFSVPCDMPSANIAFMRNENKVYLRRFLKTLNAKMLHKQRHYPTQVVLPVRMPATFGEFDSQFTGPIHGYRDAEDYWNACSSVHFLPNIQRPTLMVNAADDSFLEQACFPYELARQHPLFHLEVPQHGGHCGFCGQDRDGAYWYEQRALGFLSPWMRE